VGYRGVPVDAPSDAQLLARWRAGDRGAGQALTRRYYASVLRYFELNASSVAEDLAQATFMACVERAADVRDAAAFRGYLMGIARRQLALYLRGLSRNANYGEFDDEADAGPQRTQMSTLFARSREQVLVLRALATLPRRPQLLLVLFYWDRMRTHELAAAFGMPPSTLRTQLQRARERLRMRMEELAGVGAMRVDDDEEWLPRLLGSVLPASGAQGLTMGSGR
jgi:RNA polymerase sigma-70 factor, ECF subfamily